MQSQGSLADGSLGRPSASEPATPEGGQDAVTGPGATSHARYYGRRGLVAIVGMAVAAVLWVSRAPKTQPPTVVRDVPRVEGTAIVFSSAFLERAGIALEKVERAAFRPTLRLVGTVSLNPSYVAAVGTRLRGNVRRTFRYEGDAVVANEPLAEVESAELGEAQAAVAQREASLQAAEAHAGRQRDLLEGSLTTPREAEMAQADLLTARAALRAAGQRVRAFGGGDGFGVYVLRAPFAGDVVESHLSPGQSVDATTVGYTIADLDHLWVELSAFEKDLGSIHIGDDVQVRLPSDPSVELPGKVAHVGEVIDRATRSADVRIAVDHPRVHLRPGQSVEAILTSQLATHDALLVPRTAVAFIDGKASVFVADGDSRVRVAGVRLGASDGARHEVLGGLEPGQLVASAGVFALKSELYR